MDYWGGGGGGGRGEAKGYVAPPWPHLFLRLASNKMCNTGHAPQAPATEIELNVIMIPEDQKI